VGLLAAVYPHRDAAAVGDRLAGHQQRHDLRLARLDREGAADRADAAGAAPHVVVVTGGGEPHQVLALLAGVPHLEAVVGVAVCRMPLRLGVGADLDVAVLARGGGGRGGGRREKEDREEGTPSVGHWRFSWRRTSAGRSRPVASMAPRSWLTRANEST